MKSFFHSFFLSFLLFLSFLPSFSFFLSFYSFCPSIHPSHLSLLLPFLLHFLFPALLAFSLMCFPSSPNSILFFLPTSQYLSFFFFSFPSFPSYFLCYHIYLFLSPLHSILHVFPPFLLPVLQIPPTSFLNVIFPFISNSFFLPFPFLSLQCFFSSLLPVLLYGIMF